MSFEEEESAIIILKLKLYDNKNFKFLNKHFGLLKEVITIVKSVSFKSIYLLTVVDL